MKMIKVCILLLSALFILFGCLGKDEYPSTSTVKLELLKPGESGNAGPIEKTVYQYQPRIITGSNVLSRAANGDVVKILWTDKNAPGSEAMPTKAFVQTRLLDTIYGEKESIYEKKTAPSDETFEPLKNILAQASGKNSPYPESETIKILSRSIDVEVDQSTQTIKITAYSNNASAAAGIADAVAAAYVSFLDEDNARKIEEMIRLGLNYKKGRKELGAVEDISKMREQLSEIQRKYNLSLDENGIPNPAEINEKEKEKAALRPEIARLKIAANQLNSGNFEDRVRHFSLNGNTEVSELSKKIADLRLEVKQLEIETGKEGGDQEKKKADLQAAQTKLKTEEAKLTSLVATLMEGINRDLAEKEISLEKISSEIKEISENFFKGSTEYSELAARIENAIKSQEVQGKDSMAIGTLLSASIIARGEISPSTVHRQGPLDIKWIAIGGGIALVVIMNIVFIIYMIRKTKQKSERY